MPLAWANAVLTAALFNEPMIRCNPLWRIQLADHSVLRPVSKMKTASRWASSATGGDRLTEWISGALSRSERARSSSAAVASVPAHNHDGIGLIDPARHFVDVRSACREF